MFYYFCFVWSFSHLCLLLAWLVWFDCLIDLEYCWYFVTCVYLVATLITQQNRLNKEINVEIDFFSNFFIEMPLAEAERTKCYREKHREKVRERDNLRKKHQRELLKAESSKERLKNQRIAKAIYRQKKIKEAKEKAIIHSEPPHSQSPSSSSTFSHPSTKARCLRKVTSALTKSPCFEESIGFDVKYSFASHPVSRLISWCNNQVI